MGLEKISSYKRLPKRPLQVIATSLLLLELAACGARGVNKEGTGKWVGETSERGRTSTTITFTVNNANESKQQTKHDVEFQYGYTDRNSIPLNSALVEKISSEELQGDGFASFVLVRDFYIPQAADIRTNDEPWVNDRIYPADLEQYHMEIVDADIAVPAAGECAIIASKDEQYVALNGAITEDESNLEFNKVPDFVGRDVVAVCNVLGSNTLNGDTAFEVYDLDGNFDLKSE